MVRLLSNKHLGEVHRNVTKCTSPNHLLLSNQDKGSTPSLAHSLTLPHDPGLLNVSIEQRHKQILRYRENISKQHLI